MAKDQINFSQIGFIIGAGAHVPYGMPTSAGLTEKIKELNYPKITISSVQKSNYATDWENEKRLICKTLGLLGLHKQEVQGTSSNSFDIELGKALDNFLDSFAKSQVYSIDAFLAKFSDEHASEESQNKITEIGKVVLIYFISRYENQTPIGYHKFDWIQFLINEYLKDKDTRTSFFKNPPKFYTFNYDRILERSLMNHLINFHFLEEDTAVQMIKDLKITHIYGDLGPFEKSFDFTNISHIREAMKRIKVIGEDRLQESDEVSNSVFNGTKNLRAIYMLGYGFDTLNNKILFSRFNDHMESQQKLYLSLGKPETLNTFPPLYSTNIKLSAEDKKRSITELKSLKLYFGNKDLVDKIDSLALLKTYKPFQQVLSVPRSGKSLKFKLSQDYETEW